MSSNCFGKLVCVFLAVWASEITAAVLYVLCGGLG
jgi:hypothetical protein